METTAQLIAAFDNQKSRRHGHRIRSSQQRAINAYDLKRKLTIAGCAIIAGLFGSLIAIF